LFDFSLIDLPVPDTRDEMHRQVMLEREALIAASLDQRVLNENISTVPETGLLPNDKFFATWNCSLAYFRYHHARPTVICA
jgi:hypothetical protein